MPKVLWFNPDSVSYERAWSWQKEWVSRKETGEFPDVLILLEHPPVITLGRWGKESHLLVSKEVLQEKGIALVRCERGGDITYHGPGQLVGYPIMSLADYGLGIKAYVNRLEEVIIRSLRDFNLFAGRKEGFPGVWAEGGKIASIGVALRKGITFHGFALNYAARGNFFHFINPCGLEGVQMTSLEEATGRPVSPKDLRSRLAGHFEAVFGLELILSSDS